MSQLPKIAIVSDASYPRHTTNTQQVIKNATALAEAGIPVTLVIPRPWESLSKQKATIHQSIYDHYNVPAVLPIKIISAYPSGGKIRLEKVTHMVAASMYAALNKFDLIYTRNETLALYCLLIGKPFIFETYRRFGHEFPKAMTWLAKRAKHRALFGMVLHSEVAAASMAGVGIPRDKMIVLHNGFDMADMEPRLSRADARKQLNIGQDKKVALYAGNMQESKGIESLIDLAALVPEIDIWLVGGTKEDLQRLGDYAKAKNVNNVFMPGWQPISEVSAYLYAADVLLIPAISAPLEKFGKTVLPFKVFPYLASGRAILAGNTPDLQEILNHEETALLAPPDDTPTCVQLLQRIFDEPELKEKLEQNAYQKGQELTWAHRAQRFKKWITEKYNTTN